MSVRSIPSVSRDLQGVLEFLRDRHLLPKKPSQELLVGIKRVHRATFSLILWRFRLRQVPLHGRPFIEEIASDALQILPQALAGYIKTTHLLTRGIIENTLRYLFFCDHPIEFQKMHAPKKWFMEPREFFEYAFEHPLLEQIEKKISPVGKLKSLYADLSGFIHGGRVTDLEMRVSLNKIELNQDLFERHVVLVEKTTEAVNLILCIFNSQKFHSFQAEDRRIILRSISSSGRQILSDL